MNKLDCRCFLYPKESSMRCISCIQASNETKLAPVPKLEPKACKVIDLAHYRLTREIKEVV